MVKIDSEVPTGRISGQCDERFSAVADQFERNFRDHGEVGASLCITLNGETVVDLWGGTANTRSETPWNEDTICTVFSSTKGAVALAAHVLVSSGTLDLNAPVAKYWPEFARNGKEDATVRMMLDHSVGVPCLREPLPDLACCDWDFMVSKLENEEAFWRPGTRNGYHMISFGWTVGELIRRVAGMSLGAFFQSAIAGPTGAEFWIGLPEEKESRVARILPARLAKGAAPSRFTSAIQKDRQSIQALALLNQGGFNPNKPECRAAEIGGAGGVGNGRGLAKIYAPFACWGSFAGQTYVTEEAVSRMSEVAVATNEDATLLMPTRFGLGFMKSMDNRGGNPPDTDSAILGPMAFGHVGAGGSIGFADPECGMSLGYTMNQMGEGLLLNERGQGLVDSAYRALGFLDNKSGVWRKSIIR